MIDEAIVYESDCSKDIIDVDVQKDAILIFTSPSSVKCFLKNKSISKTNKVIVIGKTTAKALPEGIDYILSDKTTIDSCIDICQAHY
jgi:uroporphyrinogen-III synthase